MAQQRQRHGAIPAEPRAGPRGPIRNHPQERGPHRAQVPGDGAMRVVRGAGYMMEQPADAA
eukprot:CAMPEP_0119500082 /NCGR_PEP_ID=MMETSP1344-20130328/22334_1 /TAXON_ID=236787 /ORGANISM="Florenciella parvula, Strain CCMP2471" /LENGTH=60 /DNA_ID=CAMNT_0007536137 /DNA_START=26 /DNA_END=204 /DNA_ORIENTATION=+